MSRPRLHHILHVDPQLRAAFERAPRLDVSNIARVPALRRGIEALGRTQVVEGVQACEINEARLRLYTPMQRRAPGAVLWFHGGGLVMGSPSQDDAECSSLAAQLGIVVASCRYRLAPEHPFPAAAEDARAAWAWLQAHATELKLRSDRIVVAGESAGGGLAAGLVQWLRDQGEVVRPAAQLLREPMLDDRTAARVELDGRGHAVWANASNRAAWRAYLGTDPGGLVSPGAVPSRGSCEGLPPAYLRVGSLDLFADETRAYARALRYAGVPVTLDVTFGAFHTFARVAPNSGMARVVRARERAVIGRYVGSEVRT